MAPVATSNSFSQWRSPPPAATPALEPVDLPGSSSSPSVGGAKSDLLHPSFLPPCEHAKDGGEMHAHAFDLLSLAGNASSANGNKSGAAGAKASAVDASTSVPASSFLSSTRPSYVGSGTSAQPSKSRRMSSSTTGVLGRGKLGLTGDPSLGKDVRPTLSSSVSSAAAIPGRRMSSAAPGSSPQLFDFAKTDRRPVAVRTASNRGGVVAASLPNRGLLSGSAVPVATTDDMELDMEFDADDDDERSGGRSGSAELDMDMDDESKPDWEKLALGTGSGGIKGRRKGMVFKCESCSKEYRHPSCLVKHRWEHSPHWREPTQISMSKHQQVQMLEAAAILAHLDPTNAQGRSLPIDKSLWPAMLSPHQQDNKQLRSAKSTTRELPDIRSPQMPPLTPSSLPKDRKSSPASDSTSSMGTDMSPNPNSLGLENGHSRPVGIANGGRRSSVSSVPGPTTPASVGSLPDVGILNFQSGTTPTSASPIPNRGGLPLSLGARAAMIGGGMFGGRSVSNFKVPDSSLRGGAPDEEEDERRYGRGKSSSEEAEERRREDEGFEIGQMEL